MERRGCCSARSCCPSRAVTTTKKEPAAITTPKKEPVAAVKTPKVEVKPETIGKPENHQVKVENVAGVSVKKEEPVKVNVGWGGGACK